MSSKYSQNLVSPSTTADYLSHIIDWVYSALRFTNYYLGDGSYSSVYKVRRIEDNQEYALKKVKMLNLSDREKENALNEVRILASIHHKNVVSYKQAFFDEPSSSLW